MTASQRWSVLSNLAYGIVGATVWIVGGPLSGLFGLACCLLMAGSGYFHYVEGEDRLVRRRGALADELGMIAVFTTLAWLGTGVTEPALVLVSWLALGGLAPRLDSYTVIPLLGGVALAGALARGPYGWTVIILLLFSAAFYFWQDEGTSSLGHALWHFLTAAAILGLYALLAALI